MYDHKKIEKKWIKYWDVNKTYKCEYPNETNKQKFYTLVEFPYPSGTGLHVGHVKGQTAVDIFARYKRMSGFNVLNCMGWDAFGLPAENFAIKNNTHPGVFTAKNINTFKKQIKSFGPSIDWDREIDTTDSKYYRWTQWIFLELFKAGLVYEKNAPINWCPNCKTGLANEEVINGKCERCDTNVEQRLMKQWFFAITKYADRLGEDLSDLNWPEYIKISQRNWIGKSEGYEFDMKVVNSITGQKIGIISVFTTRIDTVFSMTYAVLAPDHPQVLNFISENQKKHCLDYIEKANKKSNLERTELNKNKTGVFTGNYVINPFNNEKIPLWIADYVLGNYGTGAIMAVPAHDKRDFEFAKKYNLEIKHGVYYDHSNMQYGFVRKTSNYKLRDWLFSRQRYWGEPIPLIHLKHDDLKKLQHITNLDQAVNKNLAYILKRKPNQGERCEGVTCACGSIRELVINGSVFSKIYDSIESKIVLDERLPLILPDIKDYKPSGDGQSPLAKIDSFVNVKLADNLYGKRETNTMPQWAGSSWYFLRYLDPKNENEFASKENLKYFMPVDIYFGGAEHTTVHLHYSRFWNKALYDLGIVPVSEPYKRRVQHGLIMGEDGRKMSKRWGNVINPDDVIKKYGADTMRVYIMSMGPYEDSIPWSENAIAGIYRFINKVYTLNQKIIENDDDKIIKLLHKTIKKVGEDIENISYHTAISSLMIFMKNVWNIGISKESFKIFLKLLAPFAPFITEELWHNLGEKKSIHLSFWPKFDENIIKNDKITIGIQVLGRLRGTLEININDDEKNIISKAKELESVKKWLIGKEIIREIYVPGKIVNLVIR